jgi:cadmium resistance protein CadD (predicted permease)
VAVLPVFAAAAPVGTVAVVVAMIGFVAGVLVALLSATLLATTSVVKLDHPILEHYGDVITGVTVAMMGTLIFFRPDWLHFGG